MKKLKQKRYLQLMMLIMISLLSSASLIAQPSEQWVSTFNNNTINGDDACWRSVTDANGNIYVIADTRDQFGLFDILTLKYDPAGNLLWSKSYNNNLSNSGDYAEDLCVDASGNVYVCGRSVRAANSVDGVLIKYDSTGAQQFLKRFNRTNFSDRYVRGAFMKMQGGSLFIAASFSYNNLSEYGVVRYTTNGDSVSYNALAQEPGVATALARSITGDNNTEIYVAGCFVRTNEGYDASVSKIKYNGNTATPMWTKVYSGPSHGDDNTEDIKIGPDGNIFVVSSSHQNNQGDDILLQKYGRDDGAVIWEKRYNDPQSNQDENPVKMLIDNNSNVFITGRCSTLANDDDAITLKYSSTGALLWERRYNYTGSYRDWPTGLVADNSGNIYIGISSISNAEHNSYFVTVKYSNDGTMDWQAVHNGVTNFDGPESINIDNQGNIIVAGSSELTTTGQDIVVIKYGSTIGIQPISSITPANFELSQNYPNPFNPTTNINFALPVPGKVKMLVFDIAGKQVAELINKQLSAGSYKVDFDASHLSSGIYFYQLVTENFSEVKKMILVK